jgi:hypothetical protein
MEKLPVWAEPEEIETPAGTLKLTALEIDAVIPNVETITADDWPDPAADRHINEESLTQDVNSWLLKFMRDFADRLLIPKLNP